MNNMNINHAIEYNELDDKLYKNDIWVEIDTKV